MRILFSFVGGRGHLDPLVPIARAAHAAGHAVLVSGQAGMVDTVRSLGFEARPSGIGTLFSDRQPLVAPDREREQAVVGTSFAGPIAASRAEDLVALIDAWRPDVLVCDEMDFGAMVAAEARGLPHASVVVIAAGTFIDPTLVAAPLGELRAAHGLPADPALAMLSRHLVVAPVPPTFRDPDHPLPRDSVSIRPAVLEAEAPATPPGDRPLVYVTLGTIFNLESDDLLRRVVEAIRDLPIEVLATVGPHLLPGELGPQPAHVDIVSFAPQAEVLARCAAVVCHGGSGTVVGALARGVPLVLLPLGADQMDNAQRCTDLGVGIALDVMTATAGDIRRAVERVLAGAELRRSAEAIAAESRALPPSTAAVRAIEALVDGRR